MPYRLWHGREKGIENPEIYASRASQITIVSALLPAMERKPDLVLIPGAWHTGACYDVIIPSLRDAGYHATALTLPSVGAEPPLENFDEDVKVIHDAVHRLADAGKDVVVVLHSYGGVPGSEAMKGLSREERKMDKLEGGVVGLVYLCAWWVIMFSQTCNSIASVSVCCTRLFGETEVQTRRLLCLPSAALLTMLQASQAHANMNPQDGGGRGKRPELWRGQGRERRSRQGSTRST